MRIAARRGVKAEAQKQLALARRALDSDPKMAEAQERLIPYLVGYVALYTGDLTTAARQFDAALAIEQSQGDPFLTYLQALTHETMGHADMATDIAGYIPKGVPAGGGESQPAGRLRAARGPDEGPLYQALTPTRGSQRPVVIEVRRVREVREVRTTARSF